MTTSAELSYRVSMPQPASHLFEIALEINHWQDHWQGKTLDLKFPVWTPGSYLIREYERHLQDFAAEAIDLGTHSSHQDSAKPQEVRVLPWQKIAKNHWQVDLGQVEVGSVETIRISYRLFANELTVRTNHLDASHAYFNGAATFLYVDGGLAWPAELTIDLPNDVWQVATALPLVRGAGRSWTFATQNFDELVDSPFEIGSHALYTFEAAGRSHELAVWGQGNFAVDRLLPDIQKIITTEAEIFGGLPYDRYLFLLHLTNAGYGGLEHKNSCSLIYSRFGFGQKDKRDRFLQLVAHEFFHLWNVKRIRPKGLEVFDYEAENYTSCLWFCEGATSYYDLLIPLRSGVYDHTTFLQSLSQELSRYFLTPGRQVQPLAESSFDAWIKLYRSEAHSQNHQISYYLKGEFVALILDLLIRRNSDNGRSLDDVFRRLWQEFGQDEKGYTAEELEAIITHVAGQDLRDFFQQALHTTQELPIATALAEFGLELRDNRNHQPPYVGLRLQGELGREVIKFVEAGSPAQAAGLDPGDEILAIDGLRVTAAQWVDRLKDYRPGQAIDLSYFHDDELRQARLVLGEPQANRYDILPIAEPTAEQKRLLQGWLG